MSKAPLGPFQTLNGQLTFKCTNEEGTEYILEAPVRGLKVETQVDYADSWSHDYLSAAKIFHEKQTTTITAEVVDVYTVREKKGIEVVRTAEIEAEDTTAAAIERARKRAGVPENAKFRFDFRTMGGEADADLDTPTPVKVVFYWKEKAK